MVVEGSHRELVHGFDGGGCFWCGLIMGEVFDAGLTVGLTWFLDVVEFGFLFDDDEFGVGLN